jgi:hypothetical protein
MYKRVDLYLKYLEQGIILNQSDILMSDQRRKQTFSDLDQRKVETVFTIPLGQALDLPLFQNLRPKISIELEVTGFVNAELETKLTPL